MDTQKELLRSLSADWDITCNEPLVSEAEMIQLLAYRIAMLMDKDPERFFQLMYRLDISEQKLRDTLHNAASAQEIAMIVYERQLQKVNSRLKHSQKRDTDPDMQW